MTSNIYIHLVEGKVMSKVSASLMQEISTLCWLHLMLQKAILMMLESSECSRMFSAVRSCFSLKLVWNELDSRSLEGGKVIIKLVQIFSINILWTSSPRSTLTCIVRAQTRAKIWTFPSRAANPSLPSTDCRHSLENCEIISSSPTQSHLSHSHCT